MGPTSLLTVTRQGSGLAAKVTGQPAFPIYADSQTDFHWKVVPAGVTFSGPAGAPATTATIHQNGADIAAPRIDDCEAAQIEQQISARIASNTPQPGSEAALRWVIRAAMLHSGPR